MNFSITDFVTAISTTVLAIVAIITARFALRSIRLANVQLQQGNAQLGQSELNTRFNVYKSVMDMLETTRQERAKINRSVNKNRDARIKPDEYDDDRYDLVIRNWDQLAVLVNEKLVSKKFVFDYYSLPIVNSWLYLRDKVEKERAEQNRDNYQKKFQEFAEEADEWRVKQKGYPSLLREIKIEDSFS